MLCRKTVSGSFQVQYFTGTRSLFCVFFTYYLNTFPFSKHSPTSVMLYSIPLIYSLINCQKLVCANCPIPHEELKTVRTHACPQLARGPVTPTCVRFGRDTATSHWAQTRLQLPDAPNHFPGWSHAPLFPRDRPSSGFSPLFPPWGLPSLTHQQPCRRAPRCGCGWSFHFKASPCVTFPVSAPPDVGVPKVLSGALTP